MIIADSVFSGSVGDSLHLEVFSFVLVVVEWVSWDCGRVFFVSVCFSDCTFVVVFTILHFYSVILSLKQGGSSRAEK